MKPATALALAATLLPVAACGGASRPASSPPPPPPVEACTLLTDADVSRALGAGPFMHKGSFDILNVSSTCVYRPQSQDAHGFLVLAVYPNSNPTDFAHLTRGAQPVAGLGDEATWQPDLAGVRELHVRQGNRMLSLTGPPETTEDELFTLARAALPRLVRGG